MPILVVTDRETQEVVLPESKAKVQVKAYVNRGEQKAIDGAITEGLNVKVDAYTSKVDKMDVPVSATVKTEEKMLELMIVSWDCTDEKSNPLDPTMENLNLLTPKDYDCLVNAIDGIVAGSKVTDAKKKST